MGPFAIREVESGFAVGVVKRAVDRHRAGRLIEFQQVQPIFRAGYRQTARLFGPG